MNMGVILQIFIYLETLLIFMYITFLIYLFRNISISLTNGK